MKHFFSSHYRSYNKSIPYYLHDRPCELVLHCLERLELTSDFTGISCQGKGQFTVLDFTNNLHECYEVNFRNKVEIPSCSCYDWGKQVTYTSIFLLFSKRFRHSHLIHYLQYALIVFL